jgi:hypothetical protein
MAQTLDFGRYYAHGYKYPTKRAPIWNRTTTQEIEPPYRTGSSRTVRLPGTAYAVVIGRWTSQRVTEEEALLSALAVRTITQAGDVTAATLWGGTDALAQGV